MEKHPHGFKFDSPLYTLREAAWYLNVSESTLRDWARRRDAFKTLGPSPQRYAPTVPFIGLAEAFVVAAFRRRARRMKWKYLVQVLEKLEKQVGLEYALASKRLVIHGSEILMDMAKGKSPTAEYAEALTQNQVFPEVVKGHLDRISYGEDGWADRLTLPLTEEPILELNPFRAYGQPVVINGGARMVDIVDRFNAGEDPDVVANDFGLAEEAVLDIVRVYSRKAKAAA